VDGDAAREKTRPWNGLCVVALVTAMLAGLGVERCSRTGAAGGHDAGADYRRIVALLGWPVCSAMSPQPSPLRRAGCGPVRDTVGRRIERASLAATAAVLARTPSTHAAAGLTGLILIVGTDLWLNARSSGCTRSRSPGTR